MVTSRVDRRRLLVGLGALAVVPQMTWAKDYIDLDWGDLMPKGQAASTPRLRGVIQHDQAPLVSQQPQSQGVRTEWNGNVVRLPGFIVPIDFSGTRVTAFILVPFVGACIHVPPPPANQLVLVTTERPYESSGLFEPVKVTGMFGVSSTSTHLADIGYALSADRIERYRS